MLMRFDRASVPLVIGTAIWATICLRSGEAVADAPPSTATESTKLVLVIVVTNTVGDRSKDIGRIKEVFSTGVAAANEGKEEGSPGFVEYPEPKEIVLADSYYTREDIYKLIRDLYRVDKSTTLVFYYSAHGATSIDGAKEEATPILALDAGPEADLERYKRDYIIPRPELRRVLEDRGARFTVLMTECCSDVAYGLTPKAMPYAAIDDQGLFRDLFLRPQGFLDITSSRFSRDLNTGLVHGELSWVTEDGGIFTSAFHSLLTEDKPKDKHAWDPNKVVTWPQFFEVLERRADGDFLAFKKRRLAKPWLPPVMHPDDLKELQEQPGQHAMLLQAPRATP